MKLKSHGNHGSYLFLVKVLDEHLSAVLTVVLVPSSTSNSFPAGPGRYKTSVRENQLH